MNPDFSIVVPSLGDPILLKSFLTSLEETGRNEYEVFVQIYPIAALPKDL